MGDLHLKNLIDGGQVGVVEAFRQQAQIVEVSKAGGSSAGALVAAAMLTGLPMESVMLQVVQCSSKWQDF